MGLVCTRLVETRSDRVTLNPRRNSQPSAPSTKAALWDPRGGNDTTTIINREQEQPRGAFVQSLLELEDQRRRSLEHADIASVKQGVQRWLQSRVCREEEPGIGAWQGVGGLILDAESSGESTGRFRAGLRRAEDGRVVKAIDHLHTSGSVVARAQFEFVCKHPGNIRDRTSDARPHLENRKSILAFPQRPELASDQMIGY